VADFASPNLPISPGTPPVGVPTGGARFSPVLPVHGFGIRTAID